MENGREETEETVVKECKNKWWQTPSNANKFVMQLFFFINALMFGKPGLVTS